MAESHKSTKGGWTNALRAKPRWPARHMYDSLPFGGLGWLPWDLDLEPKPPHPAAERFRTEPKSGPPAGPEWVQPCVTPGWQPRGAEPKAGPQWVQPFVALRSVGAKRPSEPGCFVRRESAHGEARTRYLDISIWGARPSGDSISRYLDIGGGDSISRYLDIGGGGGRSERGSMCDASPPPIPGPEFPYARPAGPHGPARAGPVRGAGRA